MNDPELKLVAVYQDRGYPKDIIDKLVKMSYDIARERSLTLDEAAAIVRRSVDVELKRGSNP